MSDQFREAAAGSAANSPGENPPAQDSRPYVSLAAWLRFVLPAALGLSADLWAKARIFPDGIARDPETLRLLPLQGQFAQEPQTLIPGVLKLQTTANEGMVFGMGQGHVTLFVLFSCFALGLIGWVFISSRRQQVWLHLALGMIAAGALGNLYDRAMYGAVRDFLRFDVNWYPWIFNIADALLCVGVPLLMICWAFAPSPKDAKKAAVG